MAKLIVNPTSPSKREITLPRTILSIGRDPTNDLVLPDAMVSRRHAVIEYRGNQYFVRDCNSSNGSLVNGDRVSERSLRDGDLVAIGTARLLFREEVEIEDLAAKVVQHPSAPRLQCPSCHSDHRKGDLFCKQCGAQLAPSLPAKAVCTSCGTAVPLPANFCNACGSPLTPQAKETEDLAATRPRPALVRDEAGEPATVLPSPPAPAPHPEPAAVRPPEAKTPAPPAEISPDRTRAVEVGPQSRVPARVEPAAPPPPRPPAPPARAHASASLAPSMPAAAPARPRPAPPPPPPRADTFRRDIDTSREAAESWEEPAGFGRRLAAGLLDGAILTLCGAVLVSPIFLYWWSRELPASPADVPFLPILLSAALVLLAALLAVVYHVYFWGVHGATPGKRLLELVVEGDDGSFPIGISKAVVRFFGYLVSIATLGIGFLLIAFGGSGLHDRIAGTRVVRRERG